MTRCAGQGLAGACLDSLTLLPVYLRCIFLLCWLLLPGLRCSSLNTVSWVWFGAQQSPENVVLSKLILIFSRKSQHINIFFDFHSINILDANIFSSLNPNIF